MAPGEIVRTGHTFEEVDQFITSQLLPHVQEAPLSLVATAFITLLLHSMGPEDLTGEEIAEGVKEVSGCLSTYVSCLRLTPAEIH